MAADEDVGSAIRTLLHCEKVKTGLMIVASAIQQLSLVERLTSDALMVFRYVVDALVHEVMLAYNVTGILHFKEVSTLLDNLINNIETAEDLKGSMHYISKAITEVTSGADRAAKLLLSKGLL